MKKLALMIALVGFLTIGALPALANMACAMQGIESFNVALISDSQAQAIIGVDLGEENVAPPAGQDGEDEGAPAGGGGGGQG